MAGQIRKDGTLQKQENGEKNTHFQSKVTKNTEKRRKRTTKKTDVKLVPTSK